MLIKKLLGKHKTEDYFFAVYWCGDVGIESLIVKKNNGYYDIRNHEPIELSQIGYKEKLTDYVKFNKQYITNRTAKKSAGPHFETFHKSTLKHKITKSNNHSEIGFDSVL